LARQNVSSNAAVFDPERILRVLAKHRVRYVMIGALAGRLYGLTRFTGDVDITPSSDAQNLDRLAAALRELDARLFVDKDPAGVEFDRSARALSGNTIWNLVTKAGRIDIAFVPSGTKGYEDLARSAKEFETFGLRVRVASLPDIIRSKEAANRPRDRHDVAELRALQKLQ
jgi:hypothetical protein